MTHTAWFCSLDFFLPMSHICFAHLRLRLAHALEQALPGLSGCTVAPGTPGDLARRQSQATHDSCVCFETKGLFTWSGGPRSSGVGFFCFHALGDTKQKKPTPPDRGPPLHVNRVSFTWSLFDRYQCSVYWWILPKLSAQQLVRWSFCSLYL